jgi:hypothetical protein
VRSPLPLDALESVAGISVHALVESRSGGAGGGDKKAPSRTGAQSH